VWNLCCLSPSSSVSYLSCHMDSNEHLTVELCFCGRTFSTPSAFQFHQRSCKKSKKRLAGALTKAREVWSIRKRRRLENVGDECSGHNLSISTSTQGSGIMIDSSPADLITDGAQAFRELEVEVHP
jgi:hypothetical protein